MKDKLFESHYKLGFDYFIFKQLMHLKKPKREAEVFYFGLMIIILTIALILE